MNSGTTVDSAVQFPLSSPDRNLSVVSHTIISMYMPGAAARARNYLSRTPQNIWGIYLVLTPNCGCEDPWRVE